MSLFKKYYKAFFLRGLVAMGFGGITLSLIYLSLGLSSVIDSLSVFEVVKGYLSISVLAFICGGMTIVYQIEELPIFTAILSHGIVLYLAYTIVYVLNNWLEDGLVPFLVFTIIFILSYLIIWIFIFTFTNKSTKKLNIELKNEAE